MKFCVTPLSGLYSSIFKYLPSCPQGLLAGVLSAGKSSRTLDWMCWIRSSEQDSVSVILM
jgi:hypothetical protein